MKDGRFRFERSEKKKASAPDKRKNVYLTQTNVLLDSECKRLLL